MSQVGNQQVLTSEGLPADQILVTGIWGTGHHGVYEHERENGQRFSVDVAMYLDTSAAAESDALMQTVNYAEVASAVHAVITGPPVDLIETLAAKIAGVVLVHPAVIAVDVAVHKPEAPVTVPFSDVAIVIHRRAVPATPPPPAIPPGSSTEEPRKQDILDIRPPEPVTAILALGANLDNPVQTLRQAVFDLHEELEIEVVAVSPLAQTAPVGGPEGQPDFYNAVVQVHTSLSPRQLLALCQQIESRHGRVREVTWGPRTLDLDVITYADLVAVAPDLEIPHPRAHQRAFVLQPWAHIDPTAQLLGLGGGPVQQLAQTAPDAAGIRGFNSAWLNPPQVPSTP